MGGALNPGAQSGGISSGANRASLLRRQPLALASGLCHPALPRVLLIQTESPSIVTRPLAPPCVLDIEASGFGRQSYPIEVGYVLPDGQSRCTLLQPAPDWTHWDPGAQQVHGISRQTLVTHGRPLSEVAQMLNRDLAGQTVYCDGWAHDYAWLAALFDAAGMSARFRLESVNLLLPEDSLARLDQARQVAQKALGLTRHRASNDARALQQALMAVRKA